jgi:abequosyltransferase
MMAESFAPLLSICIPTYNRSRFLREALDSIIASASGCLPDVEVVVSDNASPDDTPAVMAEYQAQFPWIRYFRNDVNVGEANFFLVAQRAKGEFVWIFGDDDKLLPRAIPAVIERIRAGHDQIIVNFSIWTKEFDAIRVPAACGKEDLVFDDAKVAIGLFSARLGFISIVVMRESLVSSIDEGERDSYYEYGASFLYVVYAVAALARRSAYIGAPLVLCRSGNSPMSPQTWDKYFVCGTHRVFDNMLAKGYSPQAIRAANDYVLRNFVFPVMLARKRDGVGVQGVYSFLLPYYKRYPSFWLLCVPALLVPGWMPQSATRIVRAIRARRHRQSS